MNKARLAHKCIVCGCFCDIMAGLYSCDSNHLTRKSKKKKKKIKNIYISACVFLKIISYLISQRYPWLCLTLCGHLAFFPCSFTNLFMFALSLQIDCKPFEDNHIYYLVLFLSFPSIVLIPSS